MTIEEKRVLVVDDDDAIRALLFTVLRRRGFAVDVARNGEEALQRCAERRYSVVLLDLMMPRKNGYEVLNEIGGLPDDERPLIIVLTAGTTPPYLDPSFVAGTIRKPFDIELIVDTVSGCLENSRGRRQRPDPSPASGERNGRARVREPN